MRFQPYSLGWAALFPILIFSGLTLVPAASGTAGGCVPSLLNPALSAGPNNSWDSQGVGYQTVLFNGSAYSMLYTGFGPNSTSTGWLALGLATSKDGGHWTRHPLPVLVPGRPGSWDSVEVDRPSVVWNGSAYLMYYTGISQTGASIGLAFSRDLVHWQKYAGNPILVGGPSAFDNVSVRFPSVLYVNESYQMWYVGRAQNHTLSIGYATSSDGIHWLKSKANPVLSNQKLPPRNSLGPRDESVVKIQSGYLMILFYGGNITYAVSIDGVNWESNADPLISNSGNSTTSDFPSAIISGNTLTVWYTVFDVQGKMTVGAATCAVLISSTVSTVTSISIATFTSTVTKVQNNAVTSVSTTTLVQTPESDAFFDLSAILGVSLAIMTALALRSFRNAKR